MSNLFKEAKKINKKGEFLAYNISGLDVRKKALCKVFMKDDYVSIYSVDKGLKLLKVLSNNNISMINMIPKRVVEKKTSLILRTIFGWMRFGFFGGIFCAINKFPLYRIVEKYNIKIKTNNESILLRLKAA